MQTRYRDMYEECCVGDASFNTLEEAEEFRKKFLSNYTEKIEFLI